MLVADQTLPLCHVQGDAQLPWCEEQAVSVGHCLTAGEADVV